MLLQILLEEFEYQVQLLVGMYNIVESAKLKIMSYSNRSITSLKAYLTILGWRESSLSSEISRMAVLGTPSSSVSRRIRFKAKNLLFVLSLAL